MGSASTRRSSATDRTCSGTSSSSRSFSATTARRISWRGPRCRPSPSPSTRPTSGGRSWSTRNGYEELKVTGIDSFDLRVPTVKPVALEFTEHRVVATVIHTDEGIDGLGYTLAFGGGGAESIQVYLETRLKPLIV